MTIPSVNASVDIVSARTPAPRDGNAGDFAALAASLARNDLAGARAAVATNADPTRNDALQSSVIEGNLAVARVMLGTMSAASAPAAAVAKVARSSDPTTPARSDRSDNSATQASIPGAVSAASRNTTIVDAGTLAAPAQAVDVAAVLLALATGNAGDIPADVINRYGPGGELYDPAAIMDAYRASPLGQSQRAAMAWIGNPA